MSNQRRLCSYEAIFNHRSSLFISLHKHKTKNKVANLLGFLTLLDAKISHNESTEKIMLAYSNEAFLTLLDIT